MLKSSVTVIFEILMQDLDPGEQMTWFPIKAPVLCCK